MSNALLQCVEIATGPAPQASVIWLHGLGADGNDFVPIVDELGLPGGLPVRFVFPHAPTRPVTINGGHVMRAWYDIALSGLERAPDEAGVRVSVAQVNTLVQRERAAGIPARRIVLAGFSQGGVIALAAGLRYPERLAGIMALSTYLALGDDLPGEAAPANGDLPVFMAHGSEDAVVPLTLAQRARERLESLGYPVEWHGYTMGHSVCQEEIAHVSTWLQRVMAP